MELRRILVPVDFSEPSRTAAREAARLAERFGATLTLLHVHPITAVAVLDVTYVEPPEHVAEMLNRAEQQLHELRGELERDTEVLVVTGEPIAEIIARSRSFDLVVMGPHGKSGLSRFLLGSVTERVVRGAHSSVLVVRPPS